MVPGQELEGNEAEGCIAGAALAYLQWEARLRERVLASI